MRRFKGSFQFVSFEATFLSRKDHFIKCECLVCFLNRSFVKVSYLPQNSLSAFHDFSFCTFLDPSEKVSLQVMSKGPIVEGNNVTLKCHADGNPPPKAFYFHNKVSGSPQLNTKERSSVSDRIVLGHCEFCHCLTLQPGSHLLRLIIHLNRRQFIKGKVQFDVRSYVEIMFWKASNSVQPVNLTLIKSYLTLMKCFWKSHCSFIFQITPA